MNDGRTIRTDEPIPQTTMDARDATWYAAVERMYTSVIQEMRARRQYAFGGSVTFPGESIPPAPQPPILRDYARICPRHSRTIAQGTHGTGVEVSEKGERW